MIGIRDFAEQYTSFWNQVLPWGNEVTRRINLELHRFAAPMLSRTFPYMRALVNEVGFRVFAERVQGGNITRARIDEILTEAQEYVRILRQADDSILQSATAIERKEALEVAERLSQFFSAYESGRTVTARPVIPGCGTLGGGVADVLCGECLYEVKAGARSVRVVDLRQILLYCALNYAADGLSIKEVGLINPRVGTFIKFSLDEFVNGLSGATPSELFSDIVQFVSSEAVSN